MATDRANYTPEELQDGAHALIHAPLKEAPYDIDELSGLLGYPNLETFAALVLDAVLPGYTQRIQAQALGDAVDVIEDSDDKTDALERVQMLRQDAARAAALAAPVEPREHEWIRTITTDGRWCEACGLPEAHDDGQPCSEQGAARAVEARLMARYEPEALARLVAAIDDVPAPSVEQPPTQEIIETDRWGL